MRTALIALNLAVAAASAALFGYTFVARYHLEGLAQEFAVRKTVAYAAPRIDEAEKALDAVLKQPAVAAMVPAGARRRPGPRSTSSAATPTGTSAGW